VLGRLRSATPDQANDPDDRKDDDGDPEQIDQCRRSVEQEPKDEKDYGRDNQEVDQFGLPPGVAVRLRRNSEMLMAGTIVNSPSS
jgi:hypothetical protein